MKVSHIVVDENGILYGFGDSKQAAIESAKTNLRDTLKINTDDDNEFVENHNPGRMGEHKLLEYENVGGTTNLNWVKIYSAEENPEEFEEYADTLKMFVR